MAIRILNAEPDRYSARARAVLLQLGEVVERPVSQADLAQTASLLMS